GTWGECVGAVVPGTESCENPGADDDCDGEDDNLGSCNTGLPGDCAAGMLHCSGITAVCEPVVAGTEVCDGDDNDCDGAIDESFPTMGAPCEGSSPNCEGTKQCVKGNEQCVLTPAGKG